MSVHTSFPQISSRFARFLCASREQVGPCSRSVCALLLILHQFQICVHQLPQCNASNYFFRASEHRCEGGCLRALHAAAARPQPPACEVAVLVCSIDLSHVAIFFTLSDATAAGSLPKKKSYSLPNYMPPLTIFQTVCQTKCHKVSIYSVYMA
jgi:hypothetical protein